MIALPEGIEASLHMFFRSDAEDLDIEMTLSGMKALPDSLTPDIPALLDQLPPLAEDWRLMTNEEITAYKEREQD